MREKKLLEWIEKHVIVLFLLGTTLLGLLVRYSLKDFLTTDSTGCLLPWYDEIKMAGGLSGLKEQVGNYNLLYQFLIALLTYIPINPLHGYKMLSCLFDYLLAGGAAYLVWILADGDRRMKAAVAYAAVLLSPVVFLNSAAWAQCDAIYVFFCIAVLLALIKERYAAAFVFLGVAFAFKLQAVFLLPAVLFFYFVKRKFSVLYFAVVPAVMCVLGLPGVFMGRSLADVFTVYFEQTDYYRSMYINYPSFWVLLENANTDRFYLDMKHGAIAVTVIVLSILMLLWLRKKVEPTGEHLVYMAFLLAYTCVLFLPAMHERYGYLYEILAIVTALLYKKTAPLAVGLILLSLSTYGWYLFEHTVDMTLLAVWNVLIYLGYAVLLGRKMMDGKKNDA